MRSPLLSGARVWLASGHTDTHKGFDGLAPLVREMRTEFMSSVTQQCFSLGEFSGPETVGFGGGVFRGGGPEEMPPPAPDS